MPLIAGIPLSDAMLPVLRRGAAAQGARPPLASVRYDKLAIAGPPGAPPVTIYVVNAKRGARRGGILHMHGGGLFLGSAGDSLAELQAIAADLDCGVVTVDYRLAPETRWQGSLEDNYTGLRWLFQHAADIGVDPARIAVMGESAGGTHAALLAIAARDRGEFRICFQCLAYPMLDDRTGSSRRVAPPIGTVGWSQNFNRFGWRAFLGQEAGTDVVPAAAVPARVENLAGLPPTFIGVGSIDLFVQEDVEYARRLIEAVVPTELLIVPGAFHGFDLDQSTRVGRDFRAAKLSALRRALT